VALTLTGERNRKKKEKKENRPKKERMGTAAAFFDDCQGSRNPATPSSLRTIILFGSAIIGDLGKLWGL